MTGGGRGGKPKAGFPPRPPPLEIAKGALPTFPLSLPDKLVQTQKTRKRTGCGGKVEIQNRDSHFSTAPNACGARKGNPTLLAGGIGHTRITHQKGGPAAVASLPPSGSFFNENMLGEAPGACLRLGLLYWKINPQEDGACIRWGPGHPDRKVFAHDRRNTATPRYG